MFRMLVAVQADHEAQRLVDWAAALARAMREPAPLEIVHVVAIANYGELGVQTGSLPDELAAAETLLRGRLANLPEGARLRVVPGEPGAAIVREAAGYDLLVIGPSHRAALAEAFLGGTHVQILQAAPCAVAVVRA